MGGGRSVWVPTSRLTAAANLYLVVARAEEWVKGLCALALAILNGTVIYSH